MATPVRRKAICHPNKNEYARGMCTSCYKHWYFETKGIKKKRGSFRDISKIEQPERYLMYRAKERAKLKNLAFDLEISDIHIPSVCPVLGIPLTLGSRGFSPNSPSIDRIDNSKGYTKDNIVVVSIRANILKKDATVDELQKLAHFYSTLQ